jgi:hypothetical protein
MGDDLTVRLIHGLSFASRISTAVITDVLKPAIGRCIAISQILKC